jgi:hypothetical protein
MARRPIKEQELETLEEEFRPLLVACLEKCEKGRWGLFGQNDVAEEGAWWNEWEDADRLKDMAKRIRILRSEFGSSNRLVEHFLYYCSLRGANIPGESKLARAFLDLIKKGEFDGSSDKSDLL